ncbi:MAG: patatin-like phospholipase family protein [Acidiferrobacterales bacterium]|nr:patatin-like phospholipase family protein [Acidiferrobacterales bacterium]
MFSKLKNQVAQISRITNTALKPAIKHFADYFRRKSDKEDSPYSEFDVYRDELALPKIAARKPDDQEESMDQLYAKGWRKGLMGLAFSGGGIRSATFNLGVIQALCELKLLRRVDYLSTVSGGGYIGSWLTALIHRKSIDPQFSRSNGPLDQDDENKGEQNEGLTEWEKANQAHSRQAENLFDGIEEELSSGHVPESKEIMHLRNYSNYLTPQVGITSADTWAAIAIYLRNLLLNLFLLIGSLMALFMALWIMIEGIVHLTTKSQQYWAAALLLGIILSALGAHRIGHDLASIADDDPQKPNGFSDSGVLVRAILPAVIASVSSIVWLTHIAEPDPSGPEWSFVPLVAPGVVSQWIFPESLLELNRFYFVMIVAAAANLMLWMIAYFVAVRTEWHSNGSNGKMWRRIILTGAFSAAALAGVLLVVGKFFHTFPLHVQIVVIPPAILIWLFLVASFHTGIVGSYMGSHYREWLSRSSAWLLITSIAWLVVTGIVILGPYIIMKMDDFISGTLVSGWLGTTVAGLLASRLKEGSKPGLIRRITLSLAPYAFIFGLLLLVSNCVSSIMFDLPQECETQVSEQRVESIVVNDQVLTIDINNNQIEPPASQGECIDSLGIYSDFLKIDSLSMSDLYLLLLLGFGIYLISKRANVNEFSLRNLYANRLVRCYLGASSDKRHANPFTGFSAFDDLPLGMQVPGDARKSPAANRSDKAETIEVDSIKWKMNEKMKMEIGLKDDADLSKSFLQDSYPGPYHLINTAVNIAKSKKLSWQERKAAPFLLSPLYSGFETPSSAEEHDLGAYRRTAEFASDQKLIYLGDAIATSGAAANPSMGYHSNGGLSFLLAIFNVRLGRWVGNPANAKTWPLSSPVMAVWYLIKEALNNTSPNDGFLQLSDGGHFDNLGLYALVKRRCRYIICCDAGADGDYKFEDLGNAIRKCRIDLGVNIKIDVSQIKERGEEGLGHTDCAVGQVFYPEENRVGVLIYIKPCKSKGMPSDVVNYASSNDSFPHQSTGDQFFSESQFESYRQLGRHITKNVFGDSASGRLRTIFNRVQERWVPTSQMTLSEFTKNAATLDSLFERMRADPKLQILHTQFNPEWRELFRTPPLRKAQAFSLPTEDPEALKSSFYFCCSVMQLMENVFIDLDLAHTHKHPDNRGWINLFKHWSWSGIFRLTYTLTISTFGARFQTFCSEVLDLTIGQVCIQRLTAKHLKENADFHSVADDSEITHIGDNQYLLNFLEWMQVKEILQLPEEPEDPEEDDPGSARYSVYQVLLAIPGLVTHIDSSTTKFSVGYAIVCESPVENTTEANKEIVMFRIQDHIRSIGIGTAGLKILRDEENVKRCAAPNILVENLMRAERSIHEIVSSERETSCTDDQRRKFEQSAKAFLTLIDDIG